MFKRVLLILIIIITGYFLINDFKVSRRVLNKECYGYLKIDSINLDKCLYPKDSKYNSLDYGLEVINLNPYVIVGHSGNGANASLNTVAKIKVGDLITLKYDNEVINYQIIKIFNHQKKEPLKLESDLIIATCSKKIRTEQIIILAQKIN